ncbi:beta-glucosidase [Cryobacterium lactosi]|uniref:Beta-glucosidase n=1 Tax=Cryobacterium lactosi TaxID=1259202 RepID=A0A4R9BFY5_9MICO|nr:glycoside hydrolase family 3 protein [Cryobacterium lactosi]TFD83527.1 beta-glucosidase [Cryobacterium lactosi]
MFRTVNKWRGFVAIGVILVMLASVTGQVLETYRSAVDQFFGTRSQITESDKLANDKDSWIYESEFKSAEQAYEGLSAFAQEEANETFSLLKNESGVLPLAEKSKITMLGVRSYAPIYGSSGGSITDGFSVVKISDAFAEKGLKLNPSMLTTYESYFADKKWVESRYGSGITPEYAEITAYDDPHEFSLDDLSALNPDYRADFEEYSDAAIVVVGRSAGENGQGYVAGDGGLADGVSTTTGNILSLSVEEREIVEEAKANFDKVVVLVNSVNPMEIAELQDDPEIDSILWIGFPGAYGFYSVADVLTGAVAPSAHLGDAMAKNTALAPAMANYGDIPWANASDFAEEDSVNSYLIQAEGIYTGYRYYETRYADIVMGNGGTEASAGTYANADGTVAETDGTWNYSNEMVYPFGYGLSYTEFEQSLDEVNVQGDKRSATATVTVTNTGDVAAKDVVQVYGAAPYTDYDIENGVEKSAIQLLDFEKTTTLEPGESQTIKINLDLNNLASYDSKSAATYIVDPGQYIISIGDDAHEALNNKLAAQGYSTADGMTADGDEAKAYSWTWDGEVDADTFSVSSTGVEITNSLSEGDSAMDYNSFEPGAVTYLTRSDWNGTFPETYAAIEANEAVSRVLRNDIIPLKTNEDTSDIIFNDTTSDLELNDLKGASFDDPRWDELLNKLDVQEFLDHAANAFHNVDAIESVGLLQTGFDDGPGGSDSHYLKEGQYQGDPWEDADEYDTGMRVAPSAVNLAYAWNKELSYRYGELILGESTLSLNLPVMGGPGMNLHRHAYNSRGVEYYSEDPILSGFIGSAVVQGAQSKGTLVNIKHVAFNDQEINRKGVAVFMSEQKARELELRNVQQAVEAKGKPASFVADPERDGTYLDKARGIMTSYNRIGAIAASANTGVMVDILRNEWGFLGYNVTDFTGVTPLAAPKESLLAGTTAFCGFKVEGIDYWTADAIAGDRDLLLAVKDAAHNTLYALANSAAMNGVNSTTRTVDVMTGWRVAYGSTIGLGVLILLIGAGGYTVTAVRSSRGMKGAN